MATNVEYNGHKLEYKYTPTFNYDGKTFKYIGAWMNYIDTLTNKKSA